MKRLIYLFFVAGFVFGSCHKENTSIQVLTYGTVTDVDGNSYKTVKIGDQWWMCENLKTTHYRDGSNISYIDINDPDTSWSNTAEGAYCHINDSIYGNLYNFKAVSDSRKLAPEGWHIPTDAEWQKLEQHIGMSVSQSEMLAWRGTNEAEKLVSKSSIGWPTGSLIFGTDEYAFNALPGGVRVMDGSTNTTQSMTFLWTSTSSSNQAYYRYIDFQHKQLFRQRTSSIYGMSIRCVKD